MGFLWVSYKIPIGSLGSYKGPKKLRAPSPQPRHLPGMPPACRACAKVGILPPRSEFRLRSSTKVGIPTSLFARKTHHRARAEGVSARLSSRVPLAECFFHHSHAQPIAPLNPGVGTLNPGVGAGLPHSILAWAQDCPGVSLKTLGVQCCTALRSQTRRPDCPENSGSALLYSRALTENSGCDAVNMAFLPDSHGFPASNLASNAKEMGKIKLFPTTEYTSKQPSDPVVPQVPCTGIFLGPSKSGKTVALISLILEQYRGVFKKIYVFSPSVNIDDGWIPVKKYIEEDLG